MIAEAKEKACSEKNDKMLIAVLYPIILQLPPHPQLHIKLTAATARDVRMLSIVPLVKSSHSAANRVAVMPPARCPTVRKVLRRISCTRELKSH